MRLNDSSRAGPDVLDHQRLGESGNPFEQAVPAGEETDQQLLAPISPLADDHLADLVFETMI